MQLLYILLLIAIPVFLGYKFKDIYRFSFNNQINLLKKIYKENILTKTNFYLFDKIDNQLLYYPLQCYYSHKFNIEGGFSIFNNQLDDLFKEFNDIEVLQNYFFEVPIKNIFILKDCDNENNFKNLFFYINNQEEKDVIYFILSLIKHESYFSYQVSNKDEYNMFKELWSILSRDTNKIYSLMEKFTLKEKPSETSIKIPEQSQYCFINEFDEKIIFPNHFIKSYGQLIFGILNFLGFTLLENEKLEYQDEINDFLEHNYNVNTNKENLVKANVFCEEIIRYLGNKFNTSNKIKLRNAIFPVLQKSGIQKVRRRDGYYYYGLTNLSKSKIGNSWFL